MIRYFDITHRGKYTLEVSYNGVEENWKNKDEIIDSNFKVRLLKKCSDNREDAPYIELWNINFGNISVPSGAWNGYKLGQIGKDFVIICLGDSIVRINKIDGNIIWKKTFGNTIITTINMPDEEEGIYILYDYYKFNSNLFKSNFRKIDKHGEIIWSFNLSGYDDIVTNFFFKDNKLKVNSHCLHMIINESNGQVIEKYETR